MGYVWCDGYVWDMCGVRYVWDMCGVRYVWDMCGVRYVWDMCGVRYANNLLKNPATKRLSGKNGEVVDWIRGKFLVTKEGNKYLAVLHNRNKMVNAFASTEWVAGSGGAVLSRSVTSCAGMTAYLVLLAQTRVGFLIVGDVGKASISSPNRSRMPRKKRPLQGRRWPSLKHSRSA